MTDVFISHSSADKKVAQKVAEQLKYHGYSVFLDFDVLVTGESFSKAIANEIENARVVVVLLSENTQRSKWVQDELAFALEKGRPERVIPVLLDSKGKQNWVWPLVSDRKPVELVSIEDGLSQLLRQVSSIAPKSYKSKTSESLYELNEAVSAPKISTRRVSTLLWITIGISTFLTFLYFTYNIAPNSVVEKTSIEPSKIEVIDETSQELISVEMLDTSNLTQSITVGAVPFTSQAIQLYRKGEYQKALELFKKAMHLIINDLPSSSSNTTEIAQIQINIGTTLSSLGRYEEALTAFQMALEMYQQVGDVSSIGVLSNNMGSVYKNMGLYEEATAAYQQSLEISRKLYGNDHPTVAVTVNNLGSVYAAMGDYDRASALFQQSLSVYEKAFGPVHPQTAALLNNLASISQSQGDLEQALALYQRALSINEVLLGAEHPSTRVIQENIERLKIDNGN